MVFRDGIAVYVSGGIQAIQSSLVWSVVMGQSTPRPPRPGYQFPRLSPDGRRIAVGIVEQDSQTWLYDIARETLTRLTFQGTATSWALGRRMASG